MKPFLMISFLFFSMFTMTSYASAENDCSISVIDGIPFKAGVVDRIACEVAQQCDEYIASHEATKLIKFLHYCEAASRVEVVLPSGNLCQMSCLAKKTSSDENKPVYRSAPSAKSSSGVR